MNITAVMSDGESRRAYDAGKLDISEAAVKTHPLSTALAVLSGYGWKLTTDQRSTMPLVERLRQDYSDARTDASAAEARMFHFERDQQGYNAAAILEAGSYEKAKLWTEVAPDVAAFVAKRDVLKVAAKIAEDDLVAAVFGDPNFIVKLDDLWVGSAIPDVNDDMTVKEQTVVLAVADDVLVNLRLLVMGQANYLGANTKELKTLRGRLRKSTKFPPTLGRIRREVSSVEADREAAEAEYAEQDRLAKTRSSAIAAAARHGGFKDAAQSAKTWAAIDNIGGTVEVEDDEE